MKKLMFSLFCMPLALGGCSGSDTPQSVPDPDPEAPTIVLSSADEAVQLADDGLSAVVTVPAEGLPEVVFTVETNRGVYDAELSDGVRWTKLSKTGEMLSLSVGDNGSLESRDAAVTLTVNGGGNLRMLLRS